MDERAHGRGKRANHVIYFGRKGRDSLQIREKRVRWLNVSA